MSKSDKLEKSSSITSSKENKEYEQSKKKVNDICQTLITNTKDYDPQITVNNINEYLAMGRILYSEITKFIFSLDEASRGIIITNIEKLWDYGLNNENGIINDGCKKLIIKLYDHCLLTFYQIEKINKINIKTNEDVEMRWKNVRNHVIATQRKLNNIEKGYISILGIFSSIILTFVGGITFSSAVLENINSASIYRLLMTIDLLALVLINVIYMLIKFIIIINDKDNKDNMIPLKKINIILIIFAIAIVAMWILNAHLIPQFLNDKFPWMT